MLAMSAETVMTWSVAPGKSSLGVQRSSLPSPLGMWLAVPAMTPTPVAVTTIDVDVTELGWTPSVMRTVMTWSRATLTLWAAGVLGALGPTVELLSHRIPQMLASDIDALHQALSDAGLLGPTAPLRMEKSLRFTLVGVLSATRIRNNIIKKVYKPILGDVVRAAVILVAGNGLVTYANAGNLSGIITAASLSIHVAKIPNSVVEGVGFESYAQANSTIMIGPDAIEQAQSILSLGLSTAQNLKDINKIQANLKAAAEIGNNTVGLVKGAISSPGAIRSGCFLDPTPGCRQLVYPDGFDSAYVNDGPLALPAPVLIVTFGLASGNVGVFIGVFLPTEPEQN